MRRRRAALMAMAAALAMLAASCTGETAQEDATTVPTGVVTSSAPSSSGTTGDATGTAAPGPAGPAPDSSREGLMLAAVTASPDVAQPGDEVAISSPFPGDLELRGPAGTVVEMSVAGSSAGLTLPPDLADGEYQLTVRGQSGRLGLGALRVASGPGIWLQADRLTVADDEVTRIRVGAHGVDAQAPVLIGLGEGWESELGPEDDLATDDADLADADFSGPAGVLTADASGMLLTGSFDATTPLGDLVGRDLFLAGTDAAAVQLVVLDPAAPLFSELLPIARCNQPATVTGSIGGPGGVRFAAASGSAESTAVLTSDGAFSIELPAGPHLLTGWLDGEPPVPLTPIPVEVPCGGTVRIGDVPAGPPPPPVPVPVVLEPAFAVKQPPCRTLIVGDIHSADGTTAPGYTQAVAGTLQGALPRAGLIAVDDVAAMAGLAFDSRWSLRPDALFHLARSTERLEGTTLVTGVRHGAGGTLTSYPDAAGDIAVSRDFESGTTEGVSRFAADLAGSALCIDAPPLHAASGDAVTWPISVTDLGGEPAAGARVTVDGGRPDTIAPAMATVDGGTAVFSYTAPPETRLETLEVRAALGDTGPAATVSSLAGSGFTYVLTGRRHLGTVAETPDLLPLLGDMEFDLWACAPHPSGPYSGWFSVDDANFLLIAEGLLGLAGGLLEAAGAFPAGAATSAPWKSPNEYYEYWDDLDFERSGSGAADAGSGDADAGNEDRSQYERTSLMAWVFGAPNFTMVITGDTLLQAAWQFGIRKTPLGTDGYHGRIAGARFEGGSITLLASDEGRLVGTLNPATGLISLDAAGVPIMNAFLLPVAVAPPACRLP